MRPYLKNGGSIIERGDRELRTGKITQQVNELAEQD